MGGEQSVQVANAFPTDIWVQAFACPIKERCHSIEVGGLDIRSRLGLDLKVNLQAKCEEKITKQSDEQMKLAQEGFTRIPVQGVTTFRPDCRGTKTVYVTIFHFDLEGNMKYSALNHPHNISHSVIVTRTGGVVDAKNKSGSCWIDITDINHKKDPCPDCKTLSTLCTLCLVTSRIQNLTPARGLFERQLCRS